MRQLLSSLEERLDEPTAKALARAVSRGIRDGLLAPGDRLPPIRQVAEQLMLSPTTVAAAWQLLARSGTIRTDGRRGTRVAETGPGGERYRTALQHHSVSRLDLSTGVPDAGLLPDLSGVLTRLNEVMTPGSYLDDPVLPQLREILESDWPYRAEDLVVVDGAMDALDLLSRTLLRPGDRVVVETPGFPPLLDLLEQRGVAVHGVGLDASGLVPDQLEAALARRAAAVIIQPRGQNPTGISMSPTRARRLARLLDAGDCVVVEDDSTGDIAASPALSLGEWLPEKVVHIRSFSKSHGPDLRLAAMSGPRALLAPVRHLRALGQGWSSRLLQRTLAALLDDDTARATVRRARGEYARRRALVVDRLAEQGITVPGTDGLNIWVPVTDEPAAVVRLASQAIAVAPGAPFAVDGVTSAPHIRVTTALVTAHHAEIADAIAEAARASSWSAQHR